MGPGGTAASETPVGGGPRRREAEDREEGSEKKSRRVENPRQAASRHDGASQSGPALNRYRIRYTSYVGPVGFRSPLPTHTRPLSQAYSGAPVSKNGAIRK